MEFIDLKSQYAEYKREIDARMARVLESAHFIMGPDVKEIETTLAAYVGVKHGIACGNGTDALLLPLLALGVGPGDEVITTAFTFAASAEVVAFLGAKPVLVDIEEHSFGMDPKALERAITSRTKAIIPVSLYGQTCDLDAIREIAKAKALPVIEDACQSFGAMHHGQKSCGLTEYAATSFFPSKPLGCYGDGGMVFTNDDAQAEKMRCLVAHGQTKRYSHKYVGLNFRLDTLQAAVLNAKFPHFEAEAEKRSRLGARYSELFAGSAVRTPKLTPWCTRHVYAQYSVRVANREAVCKALQECGIPTAVHYPIPLHLQEAYAYLGYKRGDFPVAEKVAQEIMSLPMHPFLTEADQIRVVDAVKAALA